MSVRQTAEQLAELEAREKKAREAEDRATKLRADAELHARTMLELQECELEKQRQAAASLSLPCLFLAFVLTQRTYQGSRSQGLA